MAAKYPEEYRRSMFECAICFRDMLNRNPKALPCLHTFCMECIQGLSNENKITCPSCRNQCDLGLRGVEGLPDNFHLQSLVNNILQSTETCFGCSTIGKLSEITNKCLECELEMCDSCTNIHEMKLKRKHKLVRLQVSQPDKIACKEHKNVNIKYYCEDCHELACPVCVLHGSHSTHNTVEIRDFITKAKEVLPQFQQTIEDKVHQLPTLDDDIKGNLQRTMDVKEEVKTAARLLREKIDEQELFLLQNCTEQYEKPMMEASTITNELMVILDSINNACKSRLGTPDTVSVMNKIAKWNNLVARNKVFSLKTPTFMGNQNVHLGDCKNLTFLHSLSVLNTGMEPRFHKDVEITIKDDVPLHLTALEDGGVIYAGNKSCRQIDRFGKKIFFLYGYFHVQIN